MTRVPSHGLDPMRARSVSRSMNGRAANNLPLFPITTAHTLHETVEQWRECELYSARRAESTLAWMERYLVVVDRKIGRMDVRGRFRPAVAAFYRDMRPTPAMMCGYLTGRLLRYAQVLGWRDEPHDLAGLAGIKTRERKRVLSLAERCRLIAAHEATETPRRKVCSEVILLLLHTGWRSGEACSLRWDAIDLSTGDVYLEHTKSGPQHRMIGREALAIVARQPRTHAHVFPNRRGDSHVTVELVLQWWKLVCRRLGIVGACVHTLRHSWVTAAAQLNIHPSVIASAVGHSTLYQQSRYAHVCDASVRAAADSVAEQVLLAKAVRS